MRIPDRIYITHRALRTMHDEALRFSAVGGVGENETGGILIGRRLSDENALLIIDATGPGPNALHNPVEFNPDVEAINQQLTELYRRYPQHDYIGTWHTHPRSFPGFSEGDIATIRSHFADPSYTIEESINPILHIESGNVRVNYYYMSRAMAQAGQPFLQIANVEPVDDRDPRTQTLASIPDQIGAVSLELRQAGYDLNVRRDSQHVYLAVTAPRQPGIILYLVLDPDEPIALRKIVADTPAGEQDLQDLVDQVARSGQPLRLQSVIETALRQLTGAGTAPASAAAPSTVGRALPVKPDQQPPMSERLAVEQSSWKRRIALSGIAGLMVLGFGIVLGLSAYGSLNATIMSPDPSATQQLETLGISATEQPTAISESATALESQALQDAWNLYTDRRMGAEARESAEPPDDDGAVKAWGRTVEAGEQLLHASGSANLPQLTYGARTAGPGSWLVDTRLFNSIALLRIGQIDDARTQYELAAREAANIQLEDMTGQALQTLGSLMTDIPQLWDTVNSDQPAPIRLAALQEIASRLNERARNPADFSQTAGALMADLRPAISSSEQGMSNAQLLLREKRERIAFATRDLSLLL